MESRWNAFERRAPVPNGKLYELTTTQPDEGCIKMLAIIKQTFRMNCNLFFWMVEIKRVFLTQQKMIALQ
jgi:hypothetical protein